MLKRIDINYDKIIEIIFKKKKIGQGSYGTVYEFDDEYLIKFENQMLNSADFPSEEEIARYAYKVKNNSFRSNFLFQCDIVKQQTYLSKKQANVKLSTFPSALATFRNAPLALIMKHHKGYKNLAYYDLGYDKSMDVISDIRIRHDELINNGIYCIDSSNVHNILLREEDLDVQLIDFDSKELVIDEECDNCFTSSVYARLYALNKFYSEAYVADINEYNEKIREKGLYLPFSHKDYDERRESLGAIVKKIGIKK